MCFKNRLLSVLICVLSFSLVACEEEAGYDYTKMDEAVEQDRLNREAMSEEVRWTGISKEEFEEMNGKTITIEGMAVNSKPLCYVYVTSFHILCESEDVFFWPPYIEGERVRVTGRAIVKEERELTYAQTTDYIRRYYFQVESWSCVD